MCTLMIVAGKAYSQTAENAAGAMYTYTISDGATIVLHGNTDHAAAYQWFKDGLKIDGALEKDYKANTAGMYTVVAYSAQGCPSDMSGAIRVVVNAVAAVVPANPNNGSPGTVPAKKDTAVDLTVSILSTNSHAQPGETFTYVLTANNNSQPTGTNVQVSYTVPEGLVYVPQLQDKNLTYEAATRKLTWRISSLTSNAPAKLVITVRALTSGVLQSVVKIAGHELDPVMANNIDQTVQQVYPLAVPNVFTPNGDGVNDTFVIPGLTTYTNSELTIINRWGSTIYEKINYKNDWDGQGMVEGTYFYVLKAKNNSGVWDTYKGYVTLLRTRI